MTRPSSGRRARPARLRGGRGGKPEEPNRRSRRPGAPDFFTGNRIRLKCAAKQGVCGAALSCAEEPLFLVKNGQHQDWQECVGENIRYCCRSRLRTAQEAGGRGAGSAGGSGARADARRRHVTAAGGSFNAVAVRRLPYIPPASGPPAPARRRLQCRRTAAAESAAEEGEMMRI